MSDTLNPEVEEVTSGPNRTPLLIVAGVAVAAIVGLLVWAFVLGGDDDVFEPIPSAADAARDSGEVPAAAGTVDEGPPPVETVEVFLSRDPFQPVRPDSATGPGDGDGRDGAPAPSDPSDPADPTDPAPPDDGDTDPAPKNGDDSATVEGHEVELIDVFEENGVRRVTIRVDSTLYTVGEGDTFADNFRVLSIDPPCATLLYGDNQFTLCEGERVRK
jgi:hypothetical protein